MTAGMTVYNNNSEIQIDGTYKNLYLSRKIAITAKGTTNGTFTNGEILAAVGGTTSQTIDAYCINTPKGWTCTVNTYKSGMCVYVFSTKVAKTTHGAGLQIFDPNGDIVYDSNNKHPYVIAFGNKNATLSARAVKPAIAVSANSQIDYIDTTYDVQYGQEYENTWVWQDPVYSPVTGQIVTPGGYTMVGQWVGYYYVWAEDLNRWTQENYKLNNGNVTAATVASGQSGASTRHQIGKFKTSAEAGNYKPLTQVKGYIIVNTRSWLLLDVNGL